MREAAKRGVKIYEPEEAADIEIGSGCVIVLTRSGRRIVTKNLVYATGYELPDIVPRGGYEVISTWALATRPQSGKLWTRDVLISEFVGSLPLCAFDARPPHCRRRRG